MPLKKIQFLIFVLLCLGINDVPYAHPHTCVVVIADPDTSINKTALTNTHYVVVNMNQINSKYEDFGSCYADKRFDELYFTSTRQHWCGIYDIKIDKSGRWSVPVALPDPFNGKNSDASPTFDHSYKTIYFARQVEVKGQLQKSKIYSCTRNGNAWGVPVKLAFQSDDFKYENPSLSNDDQELFFASDMQGGYGKFDIWVSHYDKKTKTWGDPVNLGAGINTSGDEVYPFSRSDSALYFSSDGHQGMGGLDIFEATKTGPDTWGNATNMGSPVNSVKDDYGIIFEGSKERGYLSSNRQGGLGDDIYSFYLPANAENKDSKKADGKRINIAGNLLQGDSSKPVGIVKVHLLNANGMVVATAMTNEFGSFVFTNLAPDSNYILQVDANDSKFLANIRSLSLTDRHGNIIKPSIGINNGKFRFEILASDTITMHKMEVEDSQLRFILKGAILSETKVALAHIIVKAMDKSGKIIGTTITDGNGQFTFTELPAGADYIIQVDATDNSMLAKISKIYITDSRKNIIKEISKNDGFKFELLPSDKSIMGQIYVNDPWIEALNFKNSILDSIHIVENIYYDYQKWDILPAATRVLDKVVSVMKNNPNILIQVYSYTDSRGEAEFNIQLSQKRADAAISYMVKHGIDKKRLTGKGLGKMNPVNNCGDPGVTCSEEQYAQNRRTEFEVIKK